MKVILELLISFFFMQACPKYEGSVVLSQLALGEGDLWIFFPQDLI